ncbi:OmpA family protein [Amycolatopsis minnesotensis]|uniref:OmpA family protein n=1 Tax=Amycolatopsis minnesotensis TaxID=337894 RepID=A0ABP5BCW2_9PSEU
MSAARLAWLVPLALLVSGALALLATWQRADGIEADLGARSDAALASAGLGGGSVTFDGRDAELRGFGADTAERAAATVRGVDGVRTVSTQDVAPTPVPAAPSSAPPSAAPPNTAPPSSPPSQPRLTKEALQSRIDDALAADPITFEPDTAELTGEGKRTAERIAELAASAPTGARLEIDGHVAKGPGGKSAARKLSQERAQAVVEVLTGAGVPADKLVAKGFGDSRPSTKGDDRRVEVEVR